MKLNCDLGESFGSWKMGLDEQVMPYIDMANIACGFHAGDPDVMQQTLLLAKQHRVTVGAHPGYQDLQGFGRRSMSYQAQEIINLIQYQVGALQALASVHGVEVTYVKPHGALYNDMMANEQVFSAVLTALAQLNKNNKPLALMILANGDCEQKQQQAQQLGVPLLLEAFADRLYTDSGALTPRSQPGAVLDKDSMLAQVKQLVTDKTVTTASGKTLAIAADTICVHGDNPQGIELIKQLKSICQV